MPQVRVAYFSMEIGLDAAMPTYVGRAQGSFDAEARARLERHSPNVPRPAKPAERRSSMRGEPGGGAVGRAVRAVRRPRAR